MPLLINADVHNGNRRVQVLDAQSGHVRLAWQGSRPDETNEADLHRLFKQLLLLSEIDRDEAD